jgi:pimeloyl-ACP methyl ester carboxylesterase
MPLHGAQRLHAEVAEGGTGPWCLFIHGFLSSRAQWMLNLEALKAVCRPVVIDLWGHGRSPAPVEAKAYTVGSYLEQFESLRERLGAEDWLVYGQSFGAGLGLQYALWHPDRVRAMVFTNTLVALSTWDPDLNPGKEAIIDQLMGEAVQARTALSALPMHPRHARRLPQEVFDAMLADAERLSPRAIALSMLHTAPELSVKDRLTELRQPLLLLNGRFERAFQPLCDFARASLPDLEVLDLDGGHAINVECAEACNQAVADFVFRCTSTRSQL